VEKVTYFDVEYANSKNKSICQIGIVCDNYIQETLIILNLIFILIQKIDLMMFVLEYMEFLRKKLKTKKLFLKFGKI